jgi:hypothetical protein
MRCALMLALFYPLAADGQTPHEENNPRAMRAARERTVAEIGPIARGFVEFWGEEAVHACRACTPKAGAKLCQFYASGGLGRLPEPLTLLRTIARTEGGKADPIVDFVVLYAAMLEDRERLRAFCCDPLTYSLALKSLEQGVEEYRYERERQEQANRRNGELRKAEAQEKLVKLSGGTAVAVLLLLAYRRHRRAAMPYYE